MHPITQVSEVTEGVRVSVLTAYQPEYSDPDHASFVFTYHIRIENTSLYTIQLLRRHWYIYEGTCITREVEGEGVKGEQPVLEPGQAHEYTSGCSIRSGIGKMMGTFMMARVVDAKRFAVKIPAFTMMVPFRLN